MIEKPGNHTNDDGKLDDEELSLRIVAQICAENDFRKPLETNGIIQKSCTLILLDPPARLVGSS